jgi:hypothetical protein
VTTAAPARGSAAGGSPSSTDPTASEVWRAAKGPLTVLLVVLLAGVLLALAANPGSSRRLDPGSAKPGGARALAELLRDQGVQVDLVTTSDRVAATTRPGDTLLVVDPDLLADSQVAQVRATGADLVLLTPTDPGRYVPGVSATRSSPGVRPPDCDLPTARRAGRADTGLLGFDTARSPLAAADLCYPRDGVPSLVQGEVDGRAVTLLGSTEGLANSGLDEEGNAALALGLLGARPRLVWYLPSTADVPAAGRTSFYDLVPHGVWWGLAQLGVAVLLLALWRARRLGAVVAEPLPVVVRAAETVEGRARLYRRTGARAQAAEALRSATRARLVPSLGLPRAADPTSVVTAVAGRSRRPAAEVGLLLYGAAPADDAALVRLADDLDTLEREVRRA